VGGVFGVVVLLDYNFEKGEGKGRGGEGREKEVVLHVLLDVWYSVCGDTDMSEFFFCLF
jgi:hypothetical protein